MVELKNLIFDMDGVLWHGDHPLTDLPLLLKRLNRLGFNVVFATNNASKTPEEYVEKFSKLGVDVSLSQIMTSAMATVAYLQRNYDPAVTQVYVVGTESLRKMLIAGGFSLLPRFDSETAADLVVIGFNREVIYEDFAAATLHIRRNGASLIGCNPDLTFPSERGLIPGNGALVALVQEAGGRNPVFIGKPEPALFEACLARLGDQATPANTAMVGDRLSTDIAGGNAAGLKTILLLSGVSQRAELEGSEIQPDYVFDHIDALTAALEEAAAGQQAG